MKRKTALLLLLAFLAALTVSFRVSGGQAETGPTAPEQSAAPENTPVQPPLPEEITIPPAETREPAEDELVRVLDHIPEIRQALAYATVNNFTGQRIYDFSDAYLRYGTVKKLAQVCQELAGQGIGLKIWDGFRPVAAQAKLWEICPDPAFVSNPVTGRRAHCRGNAVDVTLVDPETGEELPVPTGFDNFTAYADRDYSDCSAEAARNAALLEQTMEKYGFEPYFAEWWHFTDTDEYPVDEYFNPAIPVIWAANCEEYISLRKTAGGEEVIDRIPAGDLVQL